MASSKDYLDYVLELLREVRDVTYKKMMGEYLLYQDNILFGGDDAKNVELINWLCDHADLIG